MLISLNVAINSYDYTLISLLISNQFVEIKGCKLPTMELVLTYSCVQEVREREPLPNHVCGHCRAVSAWPDARRHRCAQHGRDGRLGSGVPAKELHPRQESHGTHSICMSALLGIADTQPVMFVLASEMVVDWLKHAFIAKFNHVRASVYGRFTDVLAKDVLLAGTIGDGRGRHQKRKVR